MQSRFLAVLALLSLVSCHKQEPRKVIAIDPQHFHSALALREPVEGLSGEVEIYAASEGTVADFVSRLEGYNNNGCCWKYSLHTAEDFLSMVPKTRNKDIVVLAGDNKYKTEYILEAVKKGYNVLSDKPMAIDATDYPLLEEAYALARRKGLCICEMMTERHDTIYQCVRDIIKSLPEGPDKIEMTSRHYFAKMIDGKPTKRPYWYYDVSHQGEGIADVTTHYIDMVFWQTAPGEVFDTTGLIVDGTHYALAVSPSQFNMSTSHDIEDTLNVYCNGVLSFANSKMRTDLNIIWDFIPSGTAGDGYEARYCCPHDTISIIQNASTGFKRKLYLNDDEIVIPSEAVNSHEHNFALVMADFMNYVRNGQPIPLTEEKNTLTKYYITTKAVEIANTK